MTSGITTFFHAQVFLLKRLFIIVADKMKLFESYINGTDSEKEDLERRYGKKQLLTMINDIQAEAWIGQNSKQCPHCNAPIEVFL